MSPEERIIESALRHHGVIGRDEAIALGATDHFIQQRLATGRWRRAHPDAYVVGAAPLTPHQRLMAACVAAGPDAVASHRAAAWLWGFEGFTSAPTELTVANGRGPVPCGVIVHSSKRFDPVDRTVQASIPVTTRERTLVDLGAVVRPLRVEMALESYLRKGGSIARVRQRLDALGGRGCRGVGVLREVLDGRKPGRAAGSPLEVRFTRLLRDAGARLPERQYAIPVGRGELYVVDAAYVETKVAIELQGGQYHDSARAVRRDRRRFTWLARLGWTGVEFTADEIRNQPEYVIGTLLDLVPDLFGSTTA